MKLTQEALDSLQAMAESGGLTPEAVVAAAAAKTSPLHSHFEWSNKAAAHGYRIDQARSLIRSVKVEVTIREVVLFAPKYVHDPQANNKQGYVELATKRGDTEAAREILMAELGRAITALERGNRVAAVLGLTKDMEEMIAQLTSVHARVEHEAVDTAEISTG